MNATGRNAASRASLSIRIISFPPFWAARGHADVPSASARASPESLFDDARVAFPPRSLRRGAPTPASQRRASEWQARPAKGLLVGWPDATPKVLARFRPHNLSTREPRELDRSLVSL